MSKIIKYSIVIMFCFYLVSLWTDTQTKKNKPQLSESEKQLKHEMFKSYTDGVITLKKKMKDPDSFEVESACVMPNMTVCYKYRAKNSFGALNLGVAFVTKTSFATSDQKGFNEAFKKECDMSICANVK